jgi:hypothetical protein
MPTTTDDLLTELREEIRHARADVRELRDEIRESLRHAGAMPQNAPEESKARLLREIQYFTAGRTFIVLDLLLHAEMTSLHPETSNLATAITATVGHLSGRKLGHFLASIEGQSLNGLIVQRRSNTRNGIRWRIIERKM